MPSEVKVVCWLTRDVIENNYSVGTVHLNTQEPRWSPTFDLTVRVSTLLRCRFIGQKTLLQPAEKATISTVLTTLNVYYFQNMNSSGFRGCVKELYQTRYDPLSVSYAVLTGL